MQLNHRLFAALLLAASLLPLFVAASEPVPASVDWRKLDAAAMSDLLSGYNEENEPKNLPMIEAAIAELRGRADGGDTAALALLVGFTEARAWTEQVVARRAGQVRMVDAASMAADPNVVAIRKALLKALREHPDDPHLLRAAMSRAIAQNAAEQEDWQQRYLRVVPSAWDVRLSLVKSAAGQGHYERARLEALKVLAHGPDDLQAQFLVLSELGGLFSYEQSGCTELGRALLQSMAQRMAAPTAVDKQGDVLSQLRSTTCAESVP